MPSSSLITFPYDFNKAVSYAKKWAFSRNPAYYDFSGIGGDCTNFISQCVYAGCKVMNYTPTFGWYYHSVNNRAPAWTSAAYFNRFLLNNLTAGPFAEEVSLNQIVPGDIIQLENDGGHIYHSLVVIKAQQPADASQIEIATHTIDSVNRPLDTYYYHKALYLHIKGFRQYQ